MERVYIYIYINDLLLEIHVVMSISKGSICCLLVCDVKHYIRKLNYA